MSTEHPATPHLTATSFNVADYVEQMITDPQQPVVMFERHWCSFCHSARQLFKALDVAYRSIDLEEDQFRHDGRAREIVAELSRRTQSHTVPQIFIGGQFIGGATEIIAAFRKGELKALLSAQGIEIHESKQDSESFRHSQPFPF